MVKYTLEERWEILKNYFQSDCKVSETVRKSKKMFGKNRAPSHQYVTFFVNKVQSTGLLIDSPKRNKPNTVRTPAVVEAVAQNVRESPGTSIRLRSQQLKLSRTTLMTILHKDLGMTAVYEIRTPVAIKSVDKNLSKSPKNCSCDQSQQLNLPPIAFCCDEMNKKTERMQGVK